MRREFSKQTKRQAFERSNGCCESCSAKLFAGKFRYDHIIPDGIGGEPILDNCQVICMACDASKTYGIDIPRIAKAKRISDRAKGIEKPSRGTWGAGSKTKWKRKLNGELILR